MLIGEKVKVLLQTLSLYFEGSQEYILWKIIRNFLADEKKSFMSEFLLKRISSKELEKLLVLMESRNPNLRKLSMLVLTLLISNPLSKVYFLEKCGLPLCDGKIFLTRFKYLARSCKHCDPCSVLMNIKKARMPPEFNNRRLFWAFNHTKQNMETSIKFKEIDIDILEELRESESLENIPDPLTNVLGVTFEPVELLKVDRSVSPMTSRHHQKTAQTARPNIKIRDLSSEHNTLREKRSAKDKYKNYGGNKYNKYTGRNTERSHHHADYPLKSRNRNRNTEREKIKEGQGRSSTYRGSSRTNNKFSLNLSAVRKVSIQTKYMPTSGRERKSKEKLKSNEGMMSDRWRGSSRNSGAMMGNLTDRRYYRDRDNDDTYNSILSHYKRKNELNNSVGYRAATARSKR